MRTNKINITIVGGGPVGLFLGICLSKAGIECTILEKRALTIPDSRSLGIHPISLEFFQQLGFSDDFLKAGTQIRKGIALDKKGKLGEISFSQLEKPFNFILACPQFETEKILSKRFLETNSKGLIKNSEVISIRQNDEKVTCRYILNDKEYMIDSDFIIGCDGKNSFVRQESGIFYGGKRYPDTYIMGDFEDTTNFGSNATIFLPKEGLIESFPLPNNMRRWVVKTDSLVKNPTQTMLTDFIQERIGYNLSKVKNTMLSSFGVQHFMAEKFFKNRILLAGDAAHVVSPIGGQGMNLGWIGAWKLSQALISVQNKPNKAIHFFSKYHKRQKRIVEKAAFRAELNMRLGRKQRIPYLKKILILFFLNTPFSKYATQQFAMKNLV